MVPTLAADPTFEECLRSLDNQTWRDFEVIVVDNSGRQQVRRSPAVSGSARVLENSRNVGFGAAVNQGIRASGAPFVATLNDDAAAHPEWLGALMRAISEKPRAGMCASRIRLAGDGRLDSAGMLMCADGSSKQRGHLECPEKFEDGGEVLFPSACAALYRRAMLDEIGGFDEDFFLYSEDTDLGLRARRAGWTCVYEPGAMVDHRYSWSAGRASPLKAYLVERNRLFVVVKNFPAGALVLTPWFALLRYFWHVISILRNRGSAAQFRAGGHSGFRLALFVIRAHTAALFRLRALVRKRRAVNRTARISSAEFKALLGRHSITPREVAAL